MADLALIGAPFRHWSHREFVLLSMLAALAARAGAHPRWRGWQVRLAKLLFMVAYTPRWMVAASVALFRPDYVDRSRTYRYLLIDLPTM